MVSAQGEEPVVKIETETTIDRDGGTRIATDLEIDIPSGKECGTGTGTEPEGPELQAQGT